MSMGRCIDVHESSIGRLSTGLGLGFTRLQNFRAIHADGLHRDALRMLSRDGLNYCTLRNVTDLTDWTWIAMIEIN